MRPSTRLRELLLLKRLAVNGHTAGVGFIISRRATLSKLNAAELKSASTAAALIILRQRASEISARLASLANRGKPSTEAAAKSLVASKHALSSFYGDAAVYARVYALFHSIGLSGAQLCVLSLRGFEFDAAAANYFLAAGSGERFLIGLGKQTGSRIYDNDIRDYLQDLAPDFVFLLDDGFSVNVLNSLNSGQYFIISLPASRKSAIYSDCAFLRSGAEPVMKYLFLELTVSALIKGRRSRAERAAALGVLLVDSSVHA